MGQERGSALVATAFLVLLLLLHSEPASAATYTVGGAGGWTFNLVSWPKGKAFRAGDTLVFNYATGVHNVVALNKAGYSSCTTPKGAKVYQTGKDQIKLAKGLNFFICNFPSHCESGMKIAVNAI